ncbi:hypothetical protein [Streptomyces sp. NPDC052114]|uniref:hypothetical protein n=1 Tax=unclassified Streptomyces TaxID=2593676 RepID=UPI0034340749
MSADLKIALVTGGVGGNVFLDWARHVGCSDALMNDIGCSLIDIGASIMADHLARAIDSHPCCPRPAKNIQDLRTLLQQYHTVVSSSRISGATTSDSLSLLMGDALGYPVLSIKRELPFRSSARNPSHVQDDHTCYVTVSDIEKEVTESGIIERAGWHPSLDAWSLRLIRRPSVKLHFTTIDSVLNFPLRKQLLEVMKVVA